LSSFPQLSRQGDPMSATVQALKTNNPLGVSGAK
jgi:hypothetical protein